MSVTPSASLTLGSSRYDAHLAKVTVVLSALPGPGVCRAMLPVAAAPVSAAPGDNASVDLSGLELAAGGGLGGLAGAALGAAGGGGGGLGGLAEAAAGAAAGALGLGAGASVPPGRVLTGTVRSLRRGFAGVEVEVADAGADLAAYRPAQTFTAAGADAVIAALTRDAGARPGTVDVDLPLAAYVADQSRTAAEHIARLATLGGGMAVVGADGSVGVAAIHADPDTALRYGREVLAYDVRERAAPTARVVARGAGPAGAAEAPDALRPTTEPLPQGVPDAGAGAIWDPQPVLRTPAAARAGSDALQAQADARARRVHARCVLIPALRPGAVVTVQDLPSGTPGPWLVTRVEHRLAPGAGATTDFDGVAAVGAGGAGGDGLLGALVGAAGGLL